MNKEGILDNVLEVVDREYGFRHGTAFLGVFMREGRELRLIVTAAHVVAHRTVNVKDRLGGNVPVRFHQLQDRDIAVGLPPDQLSFLQGIPVADALPKQGRVVALASRRGRHIFEKNGQSRGRLLPGVLFYQFE